MILCFLKRIRAIKPHIPVGVFFIALLVIGTGISKDYGVHWDEFYNQHVGDRWGSYALNVVRFKSLSVPLPPPDYDNHDYIHGPVFEIFLVYLADICRLKDPRDIILMRHLGVFLLFYLGLIFFYLLCKRHFQDWRLALLGCVFLVLSPRIFADAFYNSVDIAFLSIFIICLYTMVLMLDQRTLLSAFIHALTCSILIDIRFIGLYLPVVTLIFLIFETTRSCTIRNWRTFLGAFVVYIIFLCILTVFLNPLMWNDPWGSFITTISYLHFKGYILTHYMGQTKFCTSMPWHYGLIWILSSTPLIYLGFFIIGIFVSIKLFLKSEIVFFRTKRNTLIFLVCFIFRIHISVI